jgi:hypothetical protein
VEYDREHWSEEYRAYHAAVVEACVALFDSNSSVESIDGRTVRYFFDLNCDYFEEFEEGLSPKECADGQWEAMAP